PPFHLRQGTAPDAQYSCRRSGTQSPLRWADRRCEDPGEPVRLAQAAKARHDSELPLPAPDGFRVDFQELGLPIPRPVQGRGAPWVRPSALLLLLRQLVERQVELEHV